MLGDIKLIKSKMIFKLRVCDITARHSIATDIRMSNLWAFVGKVGKVHSFDLPFDPTLGYSWNHSHQSAGEVEVNETYTPYTPKTKHDRGQDGHTTFAVKVSKPGITYMTFTYAPCNGRGKPLYSLSVTITSN